jgi:hypothetical protein
MGAVYATLIADAIMFIAQVIILKKELAVNMLNTLIYAARFYPEFLRAYKEYFRKETSKNL